MGEAPSLRGFFVGAGFNSVGIASAGGAGRALAEWVVEGEPTNDLVSVDLRRFAGFNDNHRWLRDRVVETLGLHYAIPWPNRELERPGRSVAPPCTTGSRPDGRCSAAGWAGSARTFFAPDGEPPAIDYSWGKQNWLPWSAAEQRATRTGVAVFDQTSFSKYLVVGRDAGRALQWVCTNDVDVPVGTHRLHRPAQPARHLRVRPDRHPHRAEQEFLLVSSSATTGRDQDWIRRSCRPGLDAAGRRRDLRLRRARA